MKRRLRFVLLPLVVVFFLSAGLCTFVYAETLGTLGYTTVGTDGTWLAGGTFSYNFTLSQEVEFYAMGVYAEPYGNDISLSIYNNSGTWLAGTGNFTASGLAWHEQVLVSNITLEAGNYFLAVSAVGADLKFDAGVVDHWWSDSNWMPLTIDGDLAKNSYKLSIYANYSNPLSPTPTPTVTSVATAGSVLDMNWLVFAFVVFGAVLCIIPARVFLVRVVVGLFGIVLAVTQLQNSALWFYPWSLVLWLFMSVCVLYSIWARTD